MKRLIPSIIAVLLVSLSVQAKERISILDFMRVGIAVQKLVTTEELQDLTQQVRDAATGMIDPARYEVMTRENILVMLPPGKKNLAECEGQCEVETARNLGSRWHVVGDVKKVGTKLVLSIRLYDVASGTQLVGVRVRESSVDLLSDHAATPIRELLVKIPGLAERTDQAVVESVPESEAGRGLVATGSEKRPDPAKGMVEIPAGCFRKDAGFNGTPAGNRCVERFSMDATEVTQAEYRRVVGRNPSHFSKCGPDCPVESVSWKEADAYCRKVGKRLPSEDEWEYAARAGTTTKWPMGDDSTVVGDYAWYAANSLAKTHPVKRKRPNLWGIYDMAGNVNEWVHGAKDQAGGIYRGGSFNAAASWLTSSKAFMLFFAAGDRDLDMGFRCAAP